MKQKQPQVGIFWLLDGRPIVDSTPLGEAEPHCDHLTHPQSHMDVWEQWRLSGKVPAESEYEEFPRGGVMFNRKTRRFTFLADRCILRDTGLVRKIMAHMNLPSKTTATGTDSHYRCSTCLRSRSV